LFEDGDHYRDLKPEHVYFSKILDLVRDFFPMGR